MLSLPMLPPSPRGGSGLSRYTSRRATRTSRDTPPTCAQRKTVCTCCTSVCWAFVYSLYKPGQDALSRGEVQVARFGICQEVAIWPRGPSGSPSDAGRFSPVSSQTLEPEGGASAGEDAAVTAALGASAIARPKVQAGACLASEAIWNRALRGEPDVRPNTDQQIQVDGWLAGELARHMATADHQARADLQAGAGIRGGIGGFDWACLDVSR